MSNEETTSKTAPAKGGKAEVPAESEADLLNTLVFPVTVRTTIQPSVDLEVERAEWLDLYRQGLLLKEV